MLKDAPHGATVVLTVGVLKIERTMALNIICAVKAKAARGVTVRLVRRAGPEAAVPTPAARGTVVVAGKHKPIRFCLDSINEGRISTVCSGNKSSFSEEEISIGAIASIRWEFPG